MDQARSPGRVDTAHQGLTPTICEVAASGSTPSGFFEAQFVSRFTEESCTSTSQSGAHSSEGSSQSGLQSTSQVLGPEDSSARSALVEAIRIAKAEEPKPIPPQQNFAEAARVGRLEAALALLGEDDPAEPLRVALKRAKLHARVRPFGDVSICVFSTSPV